MGELAFMKKTLFGCIPAPVFIVLGGLWCVGLVDFGVRLYGLTVFC